jgi:N-acetylneuraminic acid mutarotase
MLTLGMLRRVSVVLIAGSLAALEGCGGGGGSAPPPVPVISTINGTATASGSANGTFIAYGSGFGTLSAGSPIGGNSVDFRDHATGNVVGSASWPAGGWNSTYIKAVVPNNLTVGTTYDVSVTTPGGTTGTVSFLVTKGIAFSPSTLSWAATSALPIGKQGFPTVVASLSGGTYIYTLGGNTGLSGVAGAKAANVATVNYNQLNTTTSGSTVAGTLVNAAWTTTTALPAERGFSAAVVANSYNSAVPQSANGYVYLLGGLDRTGAAQSTVYYAQINSSGTLGSWNTTTALPNASFAHGAVVFNGSLYVAGGNDASGNATATVYGAAINKDGTLGPWSTLTALPLAVAYHQLVTAGGALYVLGGTSTSGIDPTSNIQSAAAGKATYYNLINPADGTLAAAWTSTSTMNKNREKFTAVAVGANILVSGGLFGASSSTNFQSDEESYASVNTDGSLASFNGATGSKTINSVAANTFFNHSVTFFADTAGNAHVLVLGGQDIGGAVMNPGVWYQK